MPRLDGTGPQGYGPMTGRGFGRCATAGWPGRGFGFGRNRRWTARDEETALKEEEQALTEELAAVREELQSLKAKK